VGGLPNLIIPGYNGEVVSPTLEQLSAAIARLLTDEGLRERYAHRAREVGDSLGIRRWNEAVWQLISGSLLEPRYLNN
jgi:glycosyltransferase involved in cell wall biosynthesis